jgi:hypothetical protein
MSKRYKDTNKNKPMRYNMDNIGFLLRITKIPNKRNVNSKILKVNISTSFKLLVVKKNNMSKSKIPWKENKIYFLF